MSLSGVRLAVLQRDKYRCAYCGDDAQTIDHILSKAEGRRQGIERDNEAWIVAACHDCNVLRGTRRLYPPSWERHKEKLEEMTGRPWMVWSGDLRELGAEKVLR